MLQLTEQQAIAFGESGVWKGWTDDQIVRFQLFQTRLCIPWNRFHEAITKVLGRPVYTHEFAIEGHLTKEYLGEKTAPTFEEILDLIPKEKQFIVIT